MAEKKRRLGEILIAEGVLQQDELETALAEQAMRDERERLGATVLRLGLIEEEDLAAALARQLGLETVDLTTTEPEQRALDRLSDRLAFKHQVLPLELTGDDVLVVAMSDPTDVFARDDIRLTSDVRSVETRVATGTGLQEALDRHYGGFAAVAAADALDEDDDDTEVVAVEDAVEELDDTHGADDRPIIRLVNAILGEGVRGRASDIHIEPERHDLRVRYRVDGLLREGLRVPRRIAPALTSRLKIMGGLDIAERRRPQDGRAMVRVEGQEVDLRMSAMPSMFGETLVIRLLRKGAQRMDITDLGLATDVRSTLEEALARPQGLIVITGPTGSGKTTTLYGGLQELADPVRNVITLEDPIEYQLDGVNQTQINPKIGFTFARGMRTVLRQDPDVVMVGEIRDEETAELALEASMTGHLVLSTLHTNDAPSTVVRLLDLGVDRFMIASSLVLVAAQRLARRVCDGCAEPGSVDDRTMRLLGLTRDEVEAGDLRVGTGCQRCENTGFRGRTALFEALPVTPSMRELIMEGGSETAIARHARGEGMRALREDGLTKALAGTTTLEEILRVTPDISVEVTRCPACRTTVGDDFVICPACETELESTTDCPQCQRRVEADWTACPYCRRQLQNGQATPPSMSLSASREAVSA